MPNNVHMQYGVYVKCSSCQRWGNYAFVDTAEQRYDVVQRRVDCPECHRETLVSYDPYTATFGEKLSFTCINCKKLFLLILQSHDKGPYSEEWGWIEHHLIGANGVLLGLHRLGVMTYPEYTEIADLLLEAREKLKRRLYGFTEIKE